MKANLREESCIGLVVVAAVVDGSGPVVTPLDHRARFEHVRTNFVQVVSGSGCNSRPVTEGELELEIPGAQHFATNLLQCREILECYIKLKINYFISMDRYLIIAKNFPGVVDACKTSGVAP